MRRTARRVDGTHSCAIQMAAQVSSKQIILLLLGSTAPSPKRCLPSSESARLGQIDSGENGNRALQSIRQVDAVRGFFARAAFLLTSHA